MILSRGYDLPTPPCSSGILPSVGDLVRSCVGLRGLACPLSENCGPAARICRPPPTEFFPHQEREPSDGEIDHRLSLRTLFRDTLFIGSVRASRFDEDRQEAVDRFHAVPTCTTGNSRSGFLAVAERRVAPLFVAEMPTVRGPFDDGRARRAPACRLAGRRRGASERRCGGRASGTSPSP